MTFAVADASKTEAQIRAAMKAFVGLPRFNVMDPLFGAVSDGVTNDHDAIQAAVTALTAAGGGTIFFPKGAGNYLLGSAVTFESPNIHFKFEFEPGAKLIGNFADALLKRSVNSPIGGVHIVKGGRFENTHASGKGLMLHSCVAASVRNCEFSGPGILVSGDHIAGIETYNSQSVVVDSCSIIGWGVGVMAGNGTMVFNTDVTGCKHGVRHQNVGLAVYGGRYEVNTTAIVLGMKEDGTALTSSGIDIGGLSMESNDTAIHAAAAANIRIGGCGIGGGTGITLTAGLNLATVEQALVAGCSIAADEFTAGGVVVDNANRLVMAGVKSNPTTGPAWSITAPSRSTFIGCNLDEVTTKTGDSTLDGVFHKTIKLNNASTISLFVRYDTYFGGLEPPVGHEYTVINIGAGQATIAADTGPGAVTVNSVGGKNKLAQWGRATLRKTGVSEWLLSGSDLTA